MITRLYSVFDRSVQAFGAPFAQPNDAVLKRSFSEVAASEMEKPMPQRSEYFRHPDDYDVFFVGTFDSETGALAFAPAVVVFRMSHLIGG